MLERLELLAGRPPSRVVPISSGVGGSISRIHFADGATAIAKAAPLASPIDLRVEARMLDLLRESGLPTPRIIGAERGILLMEEILHNGRMGDAGQAHAATLLAALHAHTSPDGRYGLGEDNTIGPLPQANAWAADWPEFFRARRLLPMLHRAAATGAVGSPLAARIERLADRLGEFLPARPPASLIHGDVWGGNVLAHDGRIAAFIDPAPYHAHAEAEAAFITLFSTFGAGFFERYAELAGPARFERRGFLHARRDVYNLYPLLVHCVLFGGGYVAQADAALDGLGF